MTQAQASKPIIPVFPITASADGKRNAYSHYCDLVGHSKNYAVCLNLIAQRETGRLEALYSDCSVGISKGRCPALNMREKEIEKGSAIFFKERIKSLGEAVTHAAARVMSAFKRGEEKTNDLPTAPALVKKDKSHVTDEPTGNYADAINAHLAELNTPKSNTAPTVEEKVETAPTADTKGESLIEIARRMMAERAKANG